MSDQDVAVLIGFGVAVVLRVLDYFLPRGYMWKRTRDHSVRITPDDEEHDDG